ncbi:MAG: tellurite resistance TerB family protein [Cyanobium sp.]
MSASALAAAAVSPSADAPVSAPPAASTSPLTAMALPTHAAFAAIALAAVSWDGMLSMAGSRALRHALDYREPYRHLGDAAMVELMNDLLGQLRQKGAQHLMVEAAEALSAPQRATAYAVAAEIMRSDGPLQDDERNILTNLAGTLELELAFTDRVQGVMDLLHADVLTAPAD